MALTKCPECSKDVSSQAVSCPHCGFPLEGTAEKSVPPPIIVPPRRKPVEPFILTLLNKWLPTEIKWRWLIVVGLVFGAVGILTAIFDPEPARHFDSDVPSNRQRPEISTSAPRQDDNRPNTVQITKGEPIPASSPSQQAEDTRMIAKVTGAQGYPCFHQLSDIEEFNTKVHEFGVRLAAELGGLPADKVVSKMVEQNGEIERVMNDLRTQFGAAGRLWDVPVGTEVKLLKFYDDTGTEITPVWNEPQNTFYTPKGDFVIAAADWNGKTIYIMPVGEFDEKKVASELLPDSVPALKKPTKEEWKAKLAFGRYGTFFAMYKAAFLKVVGKPDRTETIGDYGYWYYDCSDGTIQVVFGAAAASATGFLQGNINDY